MTEPTTSPAVTGGSALTTGIWETAYSRRMSMASRTVSYGWTCTSVGTSAALAAQDVADRHAAGRVVLDEAVVGHPVVVEDLAEVAATAVGQQHDHDVVGGQPLGDPQRRDDRHAAGAADEQALLAGQPPGHEERVAVGHGDDLVGDRRGRTPTGQKSSPTPSTRYGRPVPPE